MGSALVKGRAKNAKMLLDLPPDVLGIVFDTLLLGGRFSTSTAAARLALHFPATRFDLTALRLASRASCAAVAAWRGWQLVWMQRLVTAVAKGRAALAVFALDRLEELDGSIGAADVTEALAGVARAVGRTARLPAASRYADDVFAVARLVLERTSRSPRQFVWHAAGLLACLRVACRYARDDIVHLLLAGAPAGAWTQDFVSRDGIERELALAASKDHTAVVALLAPLLDGEAEPAAIATSWVHNATDLPSGLERLAVE